MATWFAFKGGWGTLKLAGAQEKELVVLGFHGYATQAEAEAHRNDVGWWQKPTLQLLEVDYQQQIAQGSQAGGPNSNLLDPKSVFNIATGDAGGLFNFNATEWLIRIGEIVLGLVLVGVGLAKLTGVQNKISEVAKVATKVV